MNVVDIAVLAILAAFVLKGLFRGLLKELCSLLGLFAGAFLAFRFHASLAEILVQAGLPARIGPVAGFVLLFLATFAFFAVLGHLLSRVVRLFFLGGFNRVAGGLFGLAQGVLLLTLVLFALSLAPLPKGLQPVFRSSQLSPPFVQLGEALMLGSRQTFSGWL